MNSDFKPCTVDEARKTLWFCAQLLVGTNWLNQYVHALKVFCNEIDHPKAELNKSQQNLRAIDDVAVSFVEDGPYEDESAALEFAKRVIELSKPQKDQP